MSLSKWDLEFAILRWWIMSHLAYNYQRMQAGGFCSMMAPLLKKLYPDNIEAVKAGMKRHMMFLTQNQDGVVLFMELLLH